MSMRSTGMQPPVVKAETNLYIVTPHSANCKHLKRKFPFQEGKLDEENYA